MPRSVWIFLTVILLPSLVLAWMAVHSVRDQQVILEHQQALLDQTVTDALAQRLAAEVDAIREEFATSTRQLLAQTSAPSQLAADFDPRLRTAWPLAEVGFALPEKGGALLSPQADDGRAAARFLSENTLFLSNRENAEVYVSSNAAPSPSSLSNAAPQQNAAPERNAWQNFSLRGSNTERQVIPAQTQQARPTLSNSAPAESTFAGILGEEPSGVLARFMDNKLRLMVWCRSSPYVFGAQLRREALLERFLPLVKAAAVSPEPSYERSPATWELALLDDSGHPAVLSRPGFQADWKHPFVATEIGDALPHWEVALYLVDPAQMGRSARTLQLTIALIVVTLLVAIVLGGWLVAADIRRRTRLAQQKTDFVSNISHELKTPLTSIRMFADLLGGQRVPDPERRASYLRIISAESARLTRLINNVLDFARLDRGAASPERRPCDLAALTQEVAENLRPHFEAEGITFTTEFSSDPLPVLGDRDALSQILLNILSNAEKYGGQQILLRTRRAGSEAQLEVLDRGPGIPVSQAESIFEPFTRLEDSLASGIPGSGLGLSLARHHARAHGGDITCAPREGGGTLFTFTLPLSA